MPYEILTASLLHCRPEVLAPALALVGVLGVALYLRSLPRGP